MVRFDYGVKEKVSSLPQFGCLWLDLEVVGHGKDIVFLSSNGGRVGFVEVGRRRLIVEAGG